MGLGLEQARALQLFLIIISSPIYTMLTQLAINNSATKYSINQNKLLHKQNYI